MEEIFRRCPKLTLVTFTVIPILLIPYWESSGVLGWFPWVKGFSVMAGIVLIVLFRVTSLGRTSFGRWAIYLFLVANILEAVIKDISAGNIANYLNAVAGLLVILTLNRVDTIHLGTDGKYKDVHWDGMSLAWIIGYTIWNWVFIYLNYTLSSIHHLTVLLSALVVAFVDRERWLQTRAITLGTYFILSISIPHSDVGLFSDPYNEGFGLFVSVVALGVMISYAGHAIIAHRGRGYV
ncbi:MAG: hypothetical protein HZA94_00960 [Candidatus Vogelbacteria bacterium]|nr:hypothetical protein [Candidatus Vogelbacteria bacterium]